MAEEVAESRELATVASVVPAARLGPALNHANMATALVGTSLGAVVSKRYAPRGHDRGDLVYHTRILPNGN